MKLCVMYTLFRDITKPCIVFDPWLLSIEKSHKCAQKAHKSLTTIRDMSTVYKSTHECCLKSGGKQIYGLLVATCVTPVA